jgi:hypothetical protein
MSKVNKDRSQNKAASNGRRRKPAVNNDQVDDQDRRAAELLREAIASPGVAPLPEQPIRIDPGPPLEIPLTDLNVNTREGEQPSPQDPAGQDGQAPPRDEILLHEAVTHPGAEPIVEERLEPGKGDVREIVEERLEPGDAGTPVEMDPALITVETDKPGPHSWIQVFSALKLTTILLAYRPQRNRSADFYFIAKELRESVKKDLRNVLVLLVADVNGDGTLFLWLIPETPYSPYYNSVMQILALGKATLDAEVFRFEKIEAGSRVRQCPMRHRLRTPDDPTPILPSRPIGRLLYEALKLAGRVIEDTAHPVYVSLASGSKLP